MGLDIPFNPIGGLHHAYRGIASGFCVFNDIGIVILRARHKYGLDRVAYVDIDAHHGDGVYYEFERDPLTFIADVHEDGKFLFQEQDLGRKKEKESRRHKTQFANCSWLDRY